MSNDLIVELTVTYYDKHGQRIRYSTHRSWDAAKKSFLKLSRLCDSTKSKYFEPTLSAYWIVK